MLSYCSNYLTALPDIVVYMNCDTCLAVNLDMFDICDYDEFVFTIKNYDYADSSYIFRYKARKKDMDENGEVIFSIDPDTSKKIKPGAFYTVAILENANDHSKLTSCKKPARDGKVIIEYGAQDLAICDPEEPVVPFSDIIKAKLQPADVSNAGVTAGVLIDVTLEKLDGL